MYAQGKGVPQDGAKAREWYEKAAAQGHAGAQCRLGEMYADGRGVPQDYAQACKWWEKAAVLGDAEAQNMLGVLYANGRGASRRTTAKPSNGTRRPPLRAMRGPSTTWGGCTPKATTPS
ncbi:MAG: sel1 repeat family protein, partial [Desulfovibrio sp.]|nr:sel1 repeat family protein [Desulfovibrio sp.]